MDQGPAKHMKTSGMANPPSPEHLRDVLHSLARQHRIVPLLAAGTTIQICGPWAKLCAALRDRAVSAGFSLADVCTDMEEIEKLRCNKEFGDKWVTKETAIYIEASISRCMASDAPAGMLHKDWLLSTALLDLQRSVGKANFAAVITTNFDTLLEDATDAFKVLFRRDIKDGITFGDASSTPLLKIHGDIKHGIDEMVMGYVGHDHYQRELAPLREALRVHGAAVVFFGSSLRSESNWEQILDALFDGDAGNPPHCLITADPEDPEHEAALWSKYKIATWRFPKGDWAAGKQCMMDLCSASAHASCSLRELRLQH